MKDRHDVRSAAYPTDKDGMQASVVSSGECTGTAYSPPLDDAQAESYRQIANIPIESDGDTN